MIHIFYDVSDGSIHCVVIGGPEEERDGLSRLTVRRDTLVNHHTMKVENGTLVDL